eukprot:6095114-Lingulodinium_polyedra.AAC.1
MAELQDQKLAGPVAQLVDQLAIWCGPGGTRSLRQPCADPVEWTRRCWNRAADQLVKWSMAGRQDWTWLHPEAQRLLEANVRAFSDGGRLHIKRRAAYGWLITAWQPGEDVQIVAAEARWCEDAEPRDMVPQVIHMEVEGLCRAAKWLNRALGGLPTSAASAENLPPGALRHLRELVMQDWARASA